MEKTQSRIAIVFVAVAATVIAVGAAVFLFARPTGLNGTAIDPPQPMPDFTLESAQGPVSLNDFRGKLVVLYFGYTSCPDACPLTLSYLRQAMNNLGSRAKDVQVIFVSVDWKRDTPEKLATYTGAFNPDFIGLTGDQAQIDQVTQDFGIFYLLYPPDENGFYTVDHTASTLVLDRQGRQVLNWSNGTQPNQIASDLKKLVKE